MKNENDASYIYPGRQDAARGAHVPAWLLTLSLPAEETLTWAVMARCAGSRKKLEGFSVPRIANVAGQAEARTRSALRGLEAKGLIERRITKNGLRPSYFFPRHPRSSTVAGDYLTWSAWLRLVDNVDPETDWRSW